MQRFIVIGITDQPSPWFPPEVLQLISSGTIFSGGKRHHEIVAPLLPADAEWIDITVPLDAVFEQYRAIASLPSARRFAPLATSGTQEGEGESPQAAATPLPSRGGVRGGVCIIVFASGDPLFFGFANTIKRKMPEADVVVYPAFNSLQMLAHRLLLPYHDMRIVSLTGRPWHEFDKALLERAEKIGVLTDREHTPSAIARRMLDYGYTHYHMSVGEHLGNPSLEKVTTLPLQEAAQRDYAHPNCLILNTQENLSLISANSFPPPNHSCLINDHSCSINGNSRLRKNPSCSSRIFGIPDSAFVLLDGREKMITKMPIRLLTLQALGLPERRVFWDVGFCTGSVSIEARLQFPHLHVCAFEIRPECEAIIRKNARRFGVPGIDVHMGDFLETDLSALPRPDAVFIGGHGGRLKEMLSKILSVLTPGGIIVFNSVSSPVVEQVTARKSSRQLWDEACQALHLRQAAPLRIQLNDYNPIEILSASL